MLAISRLAAKARSKGFLREDQCEVLPRLSPAPAQIIASAEELWRAECDSKRRKVWRIAWEAVKLPFCLGVVLVAVRGVSNALFLPLLLKRIVDAIADEDVWHAGLLLGALLLERMVGAVIEYAGARLLASKVPAIVFVTLSGMLFHKAATPGVSGGRDAGVDPIPLVGRELTMLSMRMGFGTHRGFLALPTLFAGSITLFVLLGWPALFGIVSIFLSIRLGAFLQQRAKLAEERMSKAATQRLTTLGVIIGAIKAIKYFTWEPEFLAELSDFRQLECAALRESTRTKSLAFTLGKVTPVTGSLATFVAFALLGNPIRASDIFAANSVFMTMRFSVGSSTVLLELWKTTQLAFSRVECMLLLRESPPRALLAERSAADEQGAKEQQDCLAHVSDLNVTFPGSADAAGRGDGKQQAVDVFQLRVSGSLVLARRGRLTAICGAVGSGKSVLLRSLLGAIDGEACVSGIARAVAGAAWCPQQAYVVSGTVYDNILLGRKSDDALLVRCLADCCLGRDLELLSDGLDEVVGERGTTLSGGQQARLSLARTLYNEPPLLLLDDPLAAVDASVGRALLRSLRLRCAEGWDGSGVRPGALVVLNQLQWLPDFDDIIFLAAGRVEAQGSFAELKQHNAFKEFLRGITTQSMPLYEEQDAQAACEEVQRVTSVMSRSSRVTGLTTSSSLVRKEATATGLVGWPVLREYLFAPGKCFLVLLLVLFVMTFAMLGLRDWWLTVWADEDGGSKPLYLVVFVTFSMLHIIGAVIGVFMIGTFAQRAGQSLHSDCIQHLMRAPMSYFDETPSGRITSRFGSDLGQMDSMMSTQIDFTMTFGFTFFMMCVTVSVKVPWVALLFAVAMLCSGPVAHGLVIFQQDVKRHTNNAMAPILSNLSEVQRGAALIGVLNCRDFFIQRHLANVDWWTLLNMASMLTSPVAESCCHFVHLFVLAATGLLTLHDAESLSSRPGLVAMYFSYAALWGIFAMSTMSVVMGLFSNLTLLERLLEYKLGGLAQEPEWRLPSDPAPGRWPTAGAVHFEGVVLRYRAGLPCALDGLDLRVAGGEKLGIVGRTGAGKSSITSVLFRLVDCESGRVLIDGVNIAGLGVHTLRGAISMIPQEPIVMSGTVRYNLDPFGKHNDKELVRALQAAGLWPAISLEALASGAGASLSAGQRQLLTFGRTLLQSSRIVVMDEPTASVDMQTDRLVQTAAKKAFADRTVLTIAHRLDTVKDCDRLAVMDAGRLVEIGPPAKLLANPNSHLSRLTSSTHGNNVNIVVSKGRVTPVAPWCMPFGKPLRMAKR